MSRAEARARLAQAIDDVTLYLRVKGFPLPVTLKTRDPREPGRRRKHEAEDTLAVLLSRLWRAQRKRIAERLANRWPGRKAGLNFTETDFGDDFWDEETQLIATELARLLARAAADGVVLFAENSTIGIDYGLSNANATEWARSYAFELVKGINETSRQALRNAIGSFTDTPGFTIGDVVAALPYDEERAARIAITEVTRAYAQGNQLAGEQLAEEFPGVRVTKLWFTNNDDRVCPICGPLDGAEVDIGDSFTGGDGAQYDNPPAHVSCRCFSEVTTSING